MCDSDEKISTKSAGCENSQKKHHQNIFHDSPIFLDVLKVIIIIVFVYPLVYYTILNKEQPLNNSTSDQADENDHLNNASENVNLSGDDDGIELVKVKVIKRIKQPSCPLSYLLVILAEICDEVYVKKAMCTPEDVHNLEKHKIPKTLANGSTVQQGEPRATIVGCVAAGLLLTSLGAAFVELYKAKSQTPVKTTKPPMSRKCSLADLTVLKHNRKELVRRESILEMHENSSSASANKQLGYRPPLYRRCSFPVGPSEFNSNYGCTYSSYSPTPAAQESRRNSIVDTRRLSVISESRRGSIDSRRASIDVRAHSFDESPERRHWTRLVHRH